MSSHSSIDNRRTLHIPFFPSSSPPFFPIFSSPLPPPPPPPSPNLEQPTFPANFTIQTSHRSSSNHHLLLALLLPILAILVVFAFIFYLRRRRILLASRNSNPDKLSDSDRLFPPGSATSDGVQKPSAPGFLYFGTLSSSRRIIEDIEGRFSYADSTADCSSFQKFSSPELRPLPPLKREFDNDRGGAFSEEDYYSPKGSLPEKLSPGRIPSTRRSFTAGEKLSLIDSPSSRSVSSLLLPLGSSCRSLKSISCRSLGKDVDFAPLQSSKRMAPSQRISLEAERKFSSSRLSVSSRHSNSRRFSGSRPPPPPPPPPFGYWEGRVRGPPGIEQKITVETPVYRDELNEGNKEIAEETPRPKLKPLHWDKVRASSKRVMVWDQLKCSSFKVDEEMIETLFISNATNTTTHKETNNRPAITTPGQDNRVLDTKKSQNIAILLRALNVTKEEVCDALLEGKTDCLGAELLETLLKMAPTKEEELKLKDCKDESLLKLGTAEKFLKALIDIPFAFKRIDAMLYIANFESEVNYLKTSFHTLEAACEELRSSRLFLKLLDAVLKTGNRMNVGTNRGDAHAFKLDTLLKLVDVKGTDGKTTLLHFVVQEIIRAEGNLSDNNLATKTQANMKVGLKAVANLGTELSNVKKAATMDSDVLSSYVSKLTGGLGKIREVIRLNEASSVKGFSNAMEAFRKKAEDEIIKVQAVESVALSLVKEITEYFHGNLAREEAHPFRIFIVVRDFLVVLERVCKEVGRMNDRITVSSERQFPVPVNPMLGPMFSRSVRPEGSDDETSLSS